MQVSHRASFQPLAGSIARSMASRVQQSPAKLPHLQSMPMPKVPPSLPGFHPFVPPRPVPFPKPPVKLPPHNVFGRPPAPLHQDPMRLNTLQTRANTLQIRVTKMEADVSKQADVSKLGGAQPARFDSILKMLDMLRSTMGAFNSIRY